MAHASSTTIDGKFEGSPARTRDGAKRPISAVRAPVTAKDQGTVVAWPRQATTGAREDQTQVVGAWAY